MGFPGGSVVKNLPANAGDTGLIPGSGRSPGEGNGNPLQYSCLENPMDGGGAWQATVHGVTKSQTRLKRLNMHALVAQMVKNLPAVQETRVLFLGLEDPLEEKMAAHSSILAWKIPWREEPGGLQSMGSQRTGHHKPLKQKQQIFPF